MARELEIEYVAYKYRDLSRWEFRFWDDGDNGRHVVVFDVVNGRNFCVIGDNEMQNEIGVKNRIRDYALMDVDDLAPNSSLRDEWADAIVRGVFLGLEMTFGAMLT